MTSLNFDFSRSPYWDNLKGFFMLCVILAHLFLPYSMFKTELALTLMYVMPAFILLSGYMSSSKSILRSNLTKLLILFIFLQYGMALASCLYNREYLDWTQAYYSSWFLLAILLYRFSLHFIKRIKPLLAFSCIVSIIVGFSPNFDFMVMQKIIALYPFFLIGYYLRGRIPREGLSLAVPAKIMALLVGFALFTFSYYISRYNYITADDWFFHAYDTWRDAIHRIVVMFLSAIYVCILLIITPQKPIWGLSKVGKNSLSVYIFHRPLTLLFLYLFPANQ